MPVRNEEKNIANALKSVLAQTYQDFEILVVDDGSDDATAEIAKRYVGSRGQVISLKKSGRSAARNRGVKTARGALIAFLDGDDIWEPTKLEKQIGTFLDEPDPLVASVVAHELHLTETGESHTVVPAESQDWCQELLLGCGLGGSTLIVPTAAFAKVGYFDENLPRCVDHDWLLRFAASGGTIKIIPEILVHAFAARGREGRTSEIAATRFFKKHNDLYNRYAPDIKQRAGWQMWRHIAHRYSRQGSMLGAARAWLKAAMYNPKQAVSSLGRKIRRVFGG